MGRRRGRNELVAARGLDQLERDDRLDELSRATAEVTLGLARALDDELAHHAAGAKGYTVDRIARAYLLALAQLERRVPMRQNDDETWSALSAPIVDPIPLKVAERTPRRRSDRGEAVAS